MKVINTCHQTETVSIKAITSKEYVFNFAHVTVSPMYIARKTPGGAR